MSDPRLAVAPVAAPTMLRGAAIAGLGAILPSGTASNEALKLPVSDEWIFSRTGIRSRHQLSADESVVELAARASRDALDEAGVAGPDLDLILFATSTPDRVAPSSASQLAAELGAPGAAVMDIGAACAGWVSALSLGTAMVETGRCSRVLVAGSERNSRMVHIHPKVTGALFGDGAGAVVLTPTTGACRVGPIIMGNDGVNGHLLTFALDSDLYMDGPAIFEHVVHDLVDGSQRILSESGIDIDDVAVFAFHQGNARITRAVAAKLGVADDPRVVERVEETGNTSSASIPLVLDEARRRGMLHEGAIVLIGTVGAGMVWGSGILHWGGPDGA